MDETILTQVLIPLVTGLLGAVTTGFVFTSKFNARLSVIERAIEENSIAKHGIDDKLDKIIKTVTVLETQFTNVSAALNMSAARQSETTATVQALSARLSAVEAEIGNFRTSLNETRARVFVS